MVDKFILKQILQNSREEIEQYKIIHRDIQTDGFNCYIFVGVRRAGKSFLLYEKIQQLLSEGHTWDEILYLNFEDERLGSLDINDMDSILECHMEMGGVAKPALFLDEIQNIDGWEKFARRVSDSKYMVWITGSNAKMLSKEMMSTLGGRYIPIEIYPFSFAEYLRWAGIPYDEKSLLGTSARVNLKKAYEEYVKWGGLPESLGLSVKRNYISSVYQKIYLGDICTRNKISNPNLLRLLIKKIAEGVKQPVSYTRLAQVLSSVGGKISVPTTSSYICYSEDAWLLLRLHNISSSFSEKETNCKYYFVDNGILSILLVDPATTLMENLVALQLFRIYGHDQDNERVYFYSSNVEVDFYVPEDELAIQVSYSISRDIDTWEREVGALQKLPKALACKRRIILTYDEQQIIEDEYGKIEVIPCWKWMLGIEL
ncbi:MAG: ATP-binding protein [Rikenellaceae bacterium]|nr:ATP-binding protein [Rikenellaceae bacterium]